MSRPESSSEFMYTRDRDQRSGGSATLALENSNLDLATIGAKQRLGAVLELEGQGMAGGMVDPPFSGRRLCVVTFLDEEGRGGCNARLCLKALFHCQG